MAEVYDAPRATLTREQEGYPGLDRSSYFLWTVGLQLIGSAVIFAFAVAEMAAAAITFGYATFLFGFVYINVLRFRNQGASGWWVLGLFVPVLNLYVAVRAWAYPSGYNEHGELDLAAKIIIGGLACLFGLAIVAAVFVPLFAAVAPPH